MLLFDLLRLVAVVLLVLANAFFVAAEFALVGVRRTRIAELVAQGNASARSVERAIADPDRFIAATQLGITLASLGLGWIGEPALSHLIEPLINLFPAAIETEISHSLSAGLAFALITFLHVVIGELAPKSVALQNPERTSLLVARPTLWVEWIFRPAIWLLNGAGNALLKLFKIEPASGHELVHSVEELKMLVSASAGSGVVEDEAEEMLRAVFDFGETLVRLVMIPRTEMIAVPADSSLEEALQVAIEHQYTKLPVYGESLDQILGVLNLKDLLNTMNSGSDETKTARELMREAIFIPETAKVGVLLNLFRMRQRHIAIVLDEYGGTAGLVTLADLLEEIVGEVGDPFDQEPEVLPLPDGSSLVDGLMPVDDFNERFNLKLHDPYYDTIAGFMLGRLGRLAKVGDTINVEGSRLRVEAMDGLRIARISLIPRSDIKTTPPSVPDAEDQG
ncbi:MAG: HlyC/CorC family transporter [Anaerolineaceae bacterium]|nr:MAG: HlyC/CorC family transporter [Anaerolineaceae bacterium]